MMDHAPKYPKLSLIEKKLEIPMLILCFIWLCILVSELAVGMNSALSGFGTGIWFAFISYFVMRLLTSVNRRTFIKKNWFFILALLVSVLRFFPFLKPLLLVRALTATFGMQIIWIFASADLAMRSLRRFLGRRGAGYALALTLVVLFAGSAGMVHFESVSNDSQGIGSYPKALWWTAMQMTNIGTAYSIKTTGGRILCLGISVYAAGMFGYLTALFATFLIDRDTKDPKPEGACQKSVQEIQEELIHLRRLLEDLATGLPVQKPSTKGENNPGTVHKGTHIGSYP
jgi:voltage-gated potassium channel